MPARRDIDKILMIGSGPIIIGQACEFDYSGNQAITALKEEGYQVVLVNPNPATVMTAPGRADVIYMDPLEVPYLEQIIQKQRPDALLATMGGQTALNLTLDLAKAGVLDRYGVEVIGASLHSITKAEDRGEFKHVVAEAGLESPKSELVASVREANKFVGSNRLPLIIRPSFTLGGRGGSIARTLAEVQLFVKRAFAESPVHTALIEESLLGWKEFELEVMRDGSDNAVVVCSIENVDPMGVHTGDSITVAPIQTLSDRQYQRMRSAAIEILRAVGVDCGGSNVQFAVDPTGERMLVIEMNPRVSRSSALASKATGFPIARCAARLAVGFTLDEVMNEITGKTASCFEPSLDYVAVKVPRFELEKFPQGYSELGTQMKSVGESLAIGRTFIEALNKAIRAAEIGLPGMQALDQPDRVIDEMIERLDPRRLFAVYTRLVRSGASVLEGLERRTGYDRWFLHELAEYAELERQVASLWSAADFDEAPDLLLEAKRAGISDLRIARLLGAPESGTAAAAAEGAVAARREAHAITPVFHFVDTCSGEFQADTPYFYSTYGEIDEGEPVAAGLSVLIIGSGPNRIGQGLEFDTCCTLCSEAYRRRGVKTIIVNSNPETVSTDFNISDKLYLEPVTVEEIHAVILKEQPREVVVQLGGQTPLNMASELGARGITVAGTPVASILSAEDRGLFSKVISKLGLNQPENRLACSQDAVRGAADEIGYPVLIRPSFVLGGRSMGVAFTATELDGLLEKGIVVNTESPVLVDQFLEDAFEYDLDAVSDGQNIYVGGIMQHIEAAGVHSGDSACVFPVYKSEPTVTAAMVAAAASISREMGIRGFLNIQFAAKDGVLYVLEVNPRVSRTVPFVSKASGVDLVDVAVGVWLGTDLETQGLVDPRRSGIPGVGVGECLTGWAVKEAMFSFDRFHEVDPLLGPEMRSTGEVIGTGQSFGEAFAKAQAATGTPLPTSGRAFVSVNEYDKETILPIVQDLKGLGFHIVATRGTAEFLFHEGVFPEVVLKVHEGHPNLIDHMEAGRIQLVINTPKGRFTQRDDGALRIAAVRHKIPYTTTTSAARAAVEGIRYLATGELVVRPLPVG